MRIEYIKNKIKILIGSSLLKFCYSTNTRIIDGRNNYQNVLKNNISIIFSVWHGQLLSIVYDLRNKPINGVAGTHADADYISQIATKWGWNMIRGSSKENGDVAYKKIIKTLKNKGSSVFITPDGPAGPRRIPKPGIIRAAKNTGAAIIPVSVKSTKRWEFTNWDTFYLEKPFGEIHIKYGEPIFFKKNDDFKSCLKILIDEMSKIEQLNLYSTDIKFD
tara:strand:+ start:287 stop:943 length:657 start_codon:yes stop_codon:yes gene_type:complete